MNRVVKVTLRPVRNLALTAVTNILICAVLFDILEDKVKGPLGSLYWAVTTATTTGYGDLSPSTTFGRIVAMWLMLSSLAIFAVATGQIAGAVSNDPHLFSDDEQDELLDDTEDCVQMLIALLKHHDVPIPDGVEEAHERKNA